LEDTRRNQAQYGIRVLTAARGFGDHPETYRTVSVLPVLYTYIQGQLASYQLPGEWIRASAKMSSPPPFLLQTLPYTDVLFSSSLPVSLGDLLQCTRPALLTGGGARMYQVYVSVIFLDSDCTTAHSTCMHGCYSNTCASAVCYMTKGMDEIRLCSNACWLSTADRRCPGA
jgi:hypothetical protein